MKPDPMYNSISMKSNCKQEFQKNTEIAVQQAQSQAASVEDRANKVIRDMVINIGLNSHELRTLPIRHNCMLRPSCMKQISESSN